jgi:hypothetical protein
VAASLAQGKCITYRDSKTNYAVVVAMGTTLLLVARGTKESKWSSGPNLIAQPVEPRSGPARRWTNPPITETTYFYDFYIQPIKLANVDIVVHGYCENNLWHAIRGSAQQKVQGFLAASAQNTPDTGPDKC